MKETSVNNNKSNKFQKAFLPDGNALFSQPVLLNKNAQRAICCITLSILLSLSLPFCLGFGVGRRQTSLLCSAFVLFIQFS